MVDDKFYKCIIDEFEYFNHRCKNHFVLITNNRNITYKYIKEFEKIEKVRPRDFQQYLSNVDCNAVFLHNIMSLPFSQISAINSSIQVVWFAWGFDLYEQACAKPFIKIPNLYHLRTQELIDSSWLLKLKKECKKLYHKSIEKNIEKAVNRVDFFSGVIPIEYELMTFLPYFKAKSLPFKYSSPMEKIDLSLLNSMPVCGNDIMVGNSASPTNNHLDILYLLKGFNLNNRKIIVPLSYGGYSFYVKKIKSFGKKTWGDNFIALDSFVPYEEYKRLLSSCTFRIFGHERQQAMGNINIALRDGCKVFMYKSSMCYGYFLEKGIRIYSIEDELHLEIHHPLSEQQQLEQRILAIKNSLTSDVVKMIDNIIDKIANACKYIK